MSTKTETTDIMFTVAVSVLLVEGKEADADDLRTAIADALEHASGSMRLEVENEDGEYADYEVTEILPGDWNG